MIRFMAIAAGTALALSNTAHAQDFAITNATMATGDGSEPVNHATIVVRGGKVAAAGENVGVPVGITVIDGTGMWVTPGIFAPITQLGLYDVKAVGESNDTSAKGSPFAAALDAAPVINPAAQDIAINREGGVTRATVTLQAGATIFAGQGAVIDLGADSHAIIRPCAFQYVELGERGASLAGGSRTSAHALLRNALIEARTYGDRARLAGTSQTDKNALADPRLANGASRDTDALLPRFDAAALVPVVSGQQQLYVHVDRAADIRSVLSLRQEFPKLDLVIVGATEGWQVAREIAASGVPVIAAGLVDLPASFEQIAATQSNVGRMVSAGVKVALGGYEGSGDHPRNLPQQAGNLVALGKIPGAAGLKWGQALAAITSVPAEISGMAGRAGVIKPGASGDIVVWDGDPLELSSAPVRVFIDGIDQPLDNHQSRLKQRYRDLDTSDLPKAYDW